MDHENEGFTGSCPTCGQSYRGYEIERLRAALQTAEQALKGQSVVEKAYALHIVRDAIAQATGRPA
jgi:hypothetical protein